MKSYANPVYPTMYQTEYTTPPSAPPFNPDVMPRSKFADVPPELAQDVSSGRTEIVRQGMDEHEARVCLILDVSKSMQNPNKFFENEIKGNQVQMLINKALALAFLFDDNQQIEVFPFGDKAFTPPVVLNRENFTNATDIILDAIGGQLRDRTNYAEPVRAVREYYFQDRGKRRQPQLCSEPPVFAIFITDGEPNEKLIEAENEFNSASHQGIFFKFIALKGQQQDLQFAYLNKINNHDVKQDAKDPNENAFFIDCSNLVVLNDPTELNMEKLLMEYRPWLVEAFEKQLLQHDPGVKNIDINSEGRVTAPVAAQNHHALFQPKNEVRHDHQHVAANNKKPHKGCTIL